MYRIFNIILVCFLMTGCSFQSGRKTDSIVPAEIVSVPLTKDLINLLGGEDKLYSYQIYLSDSLSLYSEKESATNSTYNRGDARKNIDKHKISFTAETPGVLKRIITVKERQREYDLILITAIEVYFDKDENSFLCFKPQQRYGINNEFLLYPDLHAGEFKYFKPLPIEYEGEKWYPSNNVYLVLHFEKDAYETLQSKAARGRLVNQ